MMGKWFGNLSRRDRRIVLVALPVIVVLLVLVTLRAVPDSAGDARQRLTRALEDIAWLGAQRSRITTLRCTAGEDLEAIARRYGVALAGAVENDGARRLVIDGVAGNAAVALVRELECAGYRMRQVDWVTVDDRGAVRGSLTLDGL